MNKINEIDKRQQGIVSEVPHPDTSPEPFLKWNYEFNEKTGKNEFKSFELSDKSKDFYHAEKLFHLANKLMNTANQTMQTGLKYRSGGQQDSTGRSRS